MTSAAPFPIAEIAPPQRRARRVLKRGVTGLLGLLAVSNYTGAATLPGAEVPRAREATEAEAVVEAQPICVGSTVRSAGEIGDVLFYRKATLPDGRVAVGYYVFFSEERPWGNNWLTWSLFPALAIDLVYTRAAILAPGWQRHAYGKGDVEGFRVIYRPGPDGRLEAEQAVADDEQHRTRELSRDDLYSVDPEAITVYTDTWSHQLGGKGASADDLVYRRCYGPGTIRPLTAEVAREFNLQRRARPAAVGPLEGDSPDAERALARRALTDGASRSDAAAF